MASTYPIRFASQMREHLRALRKKRGLTQAQLGTELGVSQARIAEIEANPGLVSFEQLLKLLSHLESGLLLEVKTHDLPPPLDRGLQEPSALIEPKEEKDAIVDDADLADAKHERYSFQKKKGSW